MNSDLYAQKVNSAGAVQWAADGVALCTAANEQSGFQLLPDGSGGTIFTWQGNRSGTNNDIS